MAESPTPPAGRAGGRVLLVGAGPGDPDLITLRGARALARADVVLYDELATDDLLALAPVEALRINVGKRGHEPPTRAQDEINRLLVTHALAGRTVVRLKGGDPFVFGRGGEELSACGEAGIPFEIVPGISSAIGVPAYAGIPVTDRRHAASFAVVTGHKDPSPAAERTRWRELGNAVDTLVILMGMRNLPEIVEQLIAGGRDPRTPAAAIMHGSLPEQRTCVSTLAELPEAVRAGGYAAPSTVVIGSVVGLLRGMSWWEEQPMFGRRVLVTRAREQAPALSAALRARGATPVLVPMIELAPSQGKEERAEIDRVLARLDDYGVVVFTSSNAVRFFVRACAERAPQREAGKTDSEPGRTAARRALVSSTRVFCIGDATAQAALEAGLPVHVVASGRGDAEALLAQLLAALPGDGERVLIPRSQIARTVIADGLRAAGAEVDSVAFYENRRPAIDVAALRRELVEGGLDALTFTSPSTVDHFFSCLADESREAAGRCIIAAIGETTARRLEHHGYTPDFVPARPDVKERASGLARLDWARRA